MKRVAAISLFIMIFINSLALAGREYILKYAYPNKTKTMSIYDLLGGNSSSKTVSKKDKTGPKLISSNPKSGQLNVKVNSSIVLNFNENIKLGKNYRLISLKNGNGKSVGISFKVNKKQLIVKPSILLDYDTPYALYVQYASLKDYSGNGNNSFRISFRTEKLKIAGGNTGGSGNTSGSVDKGNDVSNLQYFSYLFDGGKNILKDYNYLTDKEYLFFADLKDIETIKDIKFDSNGIPMADYNGYKYNPLLVAEWGLQQYSLYRRNYDSNRLNNAIKAADYIVNKIDSKGKLVNGFDYKEGSINLKSPWSSSLAQGLGISLLIRIYEETEDVKYLNAAKKALEPLLKGTNEGGLAQSYAGNVLYDSFNVRTKFSLSSHMFVLFGLYDIGKYDNRAVDKLNDGVVTLKNLLPAYFSADEFYTNVHIAQLRALNSLLDDGELEKYYDSEYFEIIDIY
ncbi:hypothetical protein ABG79_00639 [Caloramator mitchellensis]|uniref:SbsA Ig-like domain-containing protein n=1 Tax=Caloramator mitchellensis TaxID=908809 RepID=A0A0R3JXN9_CALMK|nr:D-glucuronyl C5-epimerase family protein [Caloramator mitchellensis]KRQ87834.1 hypothetical protein ABG79_00639 [Caloramator mitchellensis]